MKLAANNNNNNADEFQQTRTFPSGRISLGKKSAYCDVGLVLELQLEVVFLMMTSKHST